MDPKLSAQVLFRRDKQAAIYDGVFGGYGHVSDTDIRDSRSLLLKMHWPIHPENDMCLLLDISCYCEKVP